MMRQQHLPAFRSPDFLLDHIRSIMAFYHPRCIDRQRGGYFHNFRDDGSIYDSSTRHLVSSARFVFNYAMAAREFSDPAYLDAARHGLVFLRERHRNPRTGAYAWILDGDHVRDGTNRAYGFAFVMLAYATALKAGVSQAQRWLTEVDHVMDHRFWSETDGLYKDECTEDWSSTSRYRGQNANMHICEALLSAHESSRQRKYLDRALTVARRITVDQADKADGLIWEHYDPHWEIDWAYNRNDPKNLFRPWGFQCGHQTEWAKLLLILERHRNESWLLPRAAELFEAGLAHGWDNDNGGIFYGFDPSGRVCDADKYFWVQAETLTAAALLAQRTGERRYWDWYDRIWEYAWEHMVDHRYGGWFRILDQRNHKYDDLKSPAGKTDYHTMGACYEVLNVVR